MHDPSMKKSLQQLFQGRDDDGGDEGAVLVPPDDGHGGGGGAGGGEPPPSVKQEQEVWWRRKKLLLVPKRSGVGLVIAGLVVLACLLIGSATSGRIHLDYASSFFLGGGGGGGSGGMSSRRRPPHHVLSPEADLVPIPALACGGGNTSSGTPPADAPSSSSAPAASAGGPKQQQQGNNECPEYFRFIHSDLSPWRETGITREAVERARAKAAFRLVVVDGRAYVETYHRVFQTRDTFTQWGIAQLLARYPGRVPDLDLMFNCEDMPEVRRTTTTTTTTMPLFRYCKDGDTVDIVFPDWSFWGWPEVNIRPWTPMLDEMAANMARLPWPRREPYAYWKGNPGVSPERRDLLRCNKTWFKAHVFAQNWGAATRAGFKGSNLAEQCRYRYKIYVRGRSWSVSEKYILACDSPVLLVDTPFQDFFSRGLVAGKHYWPIDPKRKCHAIRAAVDWGNAHPDEALQMAQQGSGFARDDLSMDYVYDYMLHLLTQYAALLRYKPTVPEKAVELSAEALACPAQGRVRDFMMQSRERFVAGYDPCVLPPPFTADELSQMATREQEVRARVRKITTMDDMDHHT